MEFEGVSYPPLPYFLEDRYIQDRAGSSFCKNGEILTRGGVSLPTSSWLMCLEKNKEK